MHHPFSNIILGTNCFSKSEMLKNVLFDQNISCKSKHSSRINGKINLLNAFSSIIGVRTNNHINNQLFIALSQQLSMHSLMIANATRIKKPWKLIFHCVMHSNTYLSVKYVWGLETVYCMMQFVKNFSRKPFVFSTSNQNIGEKQKLGAYNEVDFNSDPNVCKRSPGLAEIWKRLLQLIIGLTSWFDAFPYCSLNCVVLLGKFLIRRTYKFTFLGKNNCSVLPMVCITHSPWMKRE